MQSIAAISVVIFEVPTGVIADKIGRKFSLILGSSLWAISLLVYIVSDHFIIFAIAEIIFGLGGTFKSGADVALLYDTLKEVNKEREFQYVQGHARSLALYAQAIGSIVAGFVYEVNIFLPLAISIGFMIVTIIVTLQFQEPTIHEKKGKYGLGYIQQMKESSKYVIHHEKIKALILYSLIFYVFYRTGFWYFQPYMEEVHIPVKYFGILFFIFNITAAFVSKRSHIIMEKTKPRTLTFISALIIISFVLMGTIKIWIGVFAILLQQMSRGLYRPVMEKYMNKHITSDKKATILSLQSFVNNIAVALAFPFMGILKDNYDIFTTHLVLAGMMIALTGISFIYMNKRLGTNHRRINSKSMDMEKEM